MGRKQCDACFGTGRCSIEAMSNEFSKASCRVCGGSGAVYAPDPPPRKDSKKSHNSTYKKKDYSLNTAPSPSAKSRDKNKFNGWLALIAFFCIFAYINTNGLMSNGANVAVSLFGAFFVGAFYKIIIILLIVVFIIAIVTSGGGP